MFRDCFVAYAPRNDEKNSRNVEKNARNDSKNKTVKLAVPKKNNQEAHNDGKIIAGV